MRRSGAFLVAAGVFFGSCAPTAESEPSSAHSSSPTQRALTSPSSVTQGPTTEASPSLGRRPTTLIDNLFDRIESGEWSLEQGLTETLEYLNGERELGAIVADAELVEFEATPILVAAQNYLATNPGSPASQRIGELHGQIVPTPEQLRFLLGQSGQVAALARTGIVAGEPVDCSEVWHGHPLGPSPSVPCLHLDEFALPGGGTGRIYTPVGTLEGPDADRYVRLVTEAMQDSWSAFERLGDMTEVDVVFDPRGLRGASAALTGFADSPVCIMVVYPLWLVEREDDAKFILAHEAFHCFQLQVLGNYYSRVGNKWWVEGSATYFANVVYPDVNEEYLFLEWLQRYEPNHSLLELSYDAFPFFQHLGNDIGDRQVIDLQRHLIAGSPPESFPGMPDLFHGYAEDFLTGQIIDSSGEPIPIDAQAQNYGHFRPTSIGRIVEVQPKPFVIERLIVDWDENREFDLETQQIGEMLISAQQYPEGAWAQLPDPVHTCAGGLSHRVLVTRVEGAGDTRVDLNLAQVDDLDICRVRITVHGAIEAVFSGGVCYVDDNFLHVTAGFGLSDDEVEQIGPYPRGYGFILGTASAGSEEAGHPDVTITDNDGHFTDLGSNATLVKSADLLSGTFSSDDIFGDYSCPFLTPPDQLPGSAP